MNHFQHLGPADGAEMIKAAFMKRSSYCCVQGPLFQLANRNNDLFVEAPFVV